MGLQRRKPVRALKAHIGRSCLDLMAESGVVVKLLRRAEPGRHRLVVLPASLDFSFLERVKEIPDWVWEPARSGAGRVVFDASLEGYPHRLKRSHLLHRLLQRKRIPRENAVYLTQDRGYQEAYRQGFAGEPVMRVLVEDYWIRAVAGEHLADGPSAFEARLAGYRARPRRRERRFLSLNRNLRPSKAQFLLRLLQAGLWDQGFVSSGGLENRRGSKRGRMEALEEEFLGDAAFGEANRKLGHLLPRLEAMGRIEFEIPGAADVPEAVMDQPLGEYGRSWFSVVTETEMRERILRITEKPLKPLMNFHPFIVLGNPGSLRLLRAYGFRSFPEMFDESYDEEPDPRRRFEMVFGQIERLCALEESELDRLEAATEATVIHNAHRALVKLPRLFRDRMDPALIRGILAPPETSSPQSHRIAELG